MKKSLKQQFQIEFLKKRKNSKKRFATATTFVLACDLGGLNYNTYKTPDKKKFPIITDEVIIRLVDHYKTSVNWKK